MAGEPRNPIDQLAMTPWWREAGEAAESDRCAVWCGVGTTTFLSVDVAGSQCGASWDTVASKSFIGQEKVDHLQLKASRPSEACMFMEVPGDQMRNDRVVMRSTTWGGRKRSTASPV